MLLLDKRNFNICIFILTFLLFIQKTTAQSDIKVGAWRTHLTYFDAQKVALSPDGVYVSSKNGLFFYDKEFSSIETISKLDGLSDIKIGALTYLPNSEELLIGYSNGNIDFLSSDEVINFSTFLENNAFPEKQIFHIYYANNTAWISTNVGILELDTQNKRIQASYLNLGENGERIQIFATTVLDNTLYAATERGVRFISLSGNINRNDFRNWQTLSQTSDQQIDAIGTNGSALFYALRGEGVFADGSLIQSIPNQRIYDISSASDGGRVYVSTVTDVYEVAASQITRLNEQLVKAPRQVVSSGGELWIADERGGLLTNASGSFASIFPSGTYSSNTWGLLCAGSKIIAYSGGYEGNFRPLGRTTGFYVFEDGEWTNYNAENIDQTSQSIPSVRDLVGAAYSQTENKVYFASIQDGVLVWDISQNSFSVFDSNDAPFPHNRVIDVAIDAENNLWVALSGSSPSESSYLKKDINGNWEGFSFSSRGTLFPIKLEANQVGNIWSSLGSNTQGGVLVFNQNGENTVLTDTPNQGNLPSEDIRALEADQDGVMWIGSTAISRASVRTFVDYFSLFRNEPVNARDVFFESRLLLRDENINSITLDGGNRKWFGTDNGAWLFSEDADGQFLHFTIQNSPLLSNEILDVAIDGGTGEVFFATPSGIVSYRGTATDAQPNFEEVKIFPNPVRPDYDGVITIEGLTANANVKITDVSGRLVFETNSFGGTATWNGADYNGTIAKTGIYLVYVANQDGSDGFVGKIVFVR